MSHLIYYIGTLQIVIRLVPDLYGPSLFIFIVHPKKDVIVLCGLVTSYCSFGTIVCYHMIVTDHIYFPYFTVFLWYLLGTPLVT